MYRHLSVCGMYRHLSVCGMYRHLSVCGMYRHFNSHPITGLDRPQGLQEVEASRISRQSAYEGGKIVSRKHRLSLPPGNIRGTHFC